MNLEEIEQQLEQIEQMLDKIDVKEIEGKEEIKKMAEDSINKTDELIKQAVEKNVLEECHFEKLVSIYQKAKQRLSEIDMSKVGKEQQDAITKITEKADTFDQQKKAYE